MFENVVVGATGSVGGTRAVHRALEIARASDGTLHIVAATGKTRAQDPALELLAELRRMAARQSVRVETHPVSADPVEAITGVAEREAADLIVVGSRSDRGFRQISDVPKAVMDRATCAVLIV